MERPSIFVTLAEEIDALRYALGFDLNSGYYTTLNSTDDRNVFGLTEHLSKVIPGATEMILRRMSDFFKFVG